MARVITDMELWSEVRRRVLTGEMSKRAACRMYDIHWQTLEKMLKHPEPLPTDRQAVVEAGTVSADH